MNDLIHEGYDEYLVETAFDTFKFKKKDLESKEAVKKWCDKVEREVKDPNIKNGLFNLLFVTVCTGTIVAVTTPIAMVVPILGYGLAASLGGMTGLYISTHRLILISKAQKQIRRYENKLEKATTKEDKIAIKKHIANLQECLKYIQKAVVKCDKIEEDRAKNDPARQIIGKLTWQY